VSIGRFRLFRLTGETPLSAQKTLRAAEGLPSQSVAIRLRLGNLAALGAKIKGVETLFIVISGAAAPSEERLSSGRSRQCQPPSSGFCVSIFEMKNASAEEHRREKVSFRPTTLPDFR
jgi:hypothetical protein